jgi:FkbM family methyltransferase
MTFYGQFNPPFDKILKDRYLHLIQNGVGIECGAFDGLTECNLKYFEENQNWKIFNIEASPPIFEKLIKNRPKSLNFNLGLSNFKNKIVFKHAIHPSLGKNFGNGSFNHHQTHLEDLNLQGCIFEEYKVETITYKEFIEINNIDNLDCFVLDVEGYELEVIEGMKGCDILPKVFMIEYPIIGLENIVNMIEKIFPNKFILDFKIHNSVFFLLK